MSISPILTNLKQNRLHKKLDNNFLNQFIFWSWLILITASLLQCFLFNSPANLIAVGCVITAWTLTTTILFRPALFKNFPLSSFIIIGFVITQFYFPLLFTLIEGKQLIYNLNAPEEVFLHSMLALFTLLITHTIYWLFAKQFLPSSKAPRLLDRIGLFNAPTNLQVWFIGFVGLTSMFYVHFYSPSVGRQVEGALDKLIQGFIPFTYAPYFIPFGRLYGQKVSPSKALKPQLVAYTILLFFVSMGTNSRGAFMLGFTSVGFTFCLGLLLGELKTRLFTIKNIAAGLLGFWLFTGPISDIGTAMVMVRNSRYDTPRLELVALTWEAFMQKDALRAFKAANTSKGEDWDEDYMDNIFLARFCNIKYNDASLNLASQLGKGNTDVYNFTIDRFLATFPLPVLEALNINIDKLAVNGVSYGDYMYYKVSADPWSLGGFRTGHFAGTGMAAFGWWYLLILALGILPIYLAYDILFLKHRNTLVSKKGLNHLSLRFSFCGLLSLTSIFQFLPTESVENIISYLMRGWIQMILLYALIYSLTRWLSTVISPLTKSQHSLKQAH